jgi:hypothetical protein
MLICVLGIPPFCPARLQSESWLGYFPRARFLSWSRAEHEDVNSSFFASEAVIYNHRCSLYISWASRSHFTRGTSSSSAKNKTICCRVYELIIVQRAYYFYYSVSHPCTVFTLNMHETDHVSRAFSVAAIL